MMHNWFECKVRYEKMMENGSQNKMIKEHLMEGKGLTALGTLNLYGCLRLPNRIHDLRHLHGLKIKTGRININGKYLASYTLEN